MSNSSLASRLRKLRGSRSRKEMTRALALAGFKCSPARLYDLETGRSRIPAEALPAYALALDLPPSEQFALLGMPAASPAEASAA